MLPPGGQARVMPSVCLLVTGRPGNREGGSIGVGGYEQGLGLLLSISEHSLDSSKKLP